MLCVPLGFSQTPNLRITEEVAKFEAAAFKRSLKGTTINRSYRGFFDVTKQSIDIKVNPGIRFIEGAVTTTFTIIEGGYNEIELNCSDSLKVSSVLLDGNSAEYSAGRDFLVIKSSNELVPETNHVLQITYSGIPPATRAFETDTNNYGDTVMWTLSEPYGAKDWWPCKQDLADKFDQLDMRVTVPKKYKVAANGLLQSITPIGLNDLQYHWKHNYPIVTYLVAFAVADYVVMTETLDLKEGELEFVNYVYPQDSATAAEDLREFKNTMDLFEDLLGPYPFRKEHYGHAQFGWGGGMEHQTMSFMNNFQYPLVAHELAHQWFGDHVTCGSWEDLWLNESFATYFEGLTVERFQSKALWDYWKVLKTNNITKKPDGSVFVTDTNNINRLFNGRLTYNKGAYVLNMLRWQVGDSTFFAAIRNYLSDPNLAGGYARTSDLQSHMEAISGQNLQNFFDIWFLGEGYPTYQVNWNQQQDSTLNLTVNQSTSHPSVPFYAMPLPIRAEGWTRDTVLRLDHTFSGESFSAKIPFQVIKVVMNHDLWLLTGENQVIGLRENMLEAQVSIYPNPAKDRIYLEGLEASNTEIEFKLFDTFGRLVITQTIKPNTNPIELDVHTLKPGFYLLKAITENGPISQEIIVH
mgnify:CR=1 FL=1